MNGVMPTWYDRAVARLDRGRREPNGRASGTIIDKVKITLRNGKL
jgi:hypothetical protein